VHLLLCFIPLLFANDTLATPGAGGVIPLRSAEIAMEREDLEISVRELRGRADSRVYTLLAELDDSHPVFLATAVPREERSRGATQLPTRSGRRLLDCHR